MDKLNQEILIAKEKLLQGGVIAFPTETVFGLGVIYNNYDAYLRLNKIKHRHEDKPYTMMLGSISEIDKYAFIDEKINKVINKFMPGSITILLKCKDNVPSYVTHSSGIIGIRIPSNIEALSILKEVNIPLLVPSANRADEKPAYTAKEVKEIFDDELDFIMPGSCISKEPSTIISYINNEIKLIREGPISLTQILEVYNG